MEEVSEDQVENSESGSDDNESRPSRQTSPVTYLPLSKSNQTRGKESRIENVGSRIWKRIRSKLLQEEQQVKLSECKKLFEKIWNILGLSTAGKHIRHNNFVCIEKISTPIGFINIRENFYLDPRNPKCRSGGNLSLNYKTLKDFEDDMKLVIENAEIFYRGWRNESQIVEDVAHFFRSKMKTIKESSTYKQRECTNRRSKNATSMERTARSFEESMDIAVELSSNEEPRMPRQIVVESVLLPNLATATYSKLSRPSQTASANAILLETDSDSDMEYQSSILESEKTDDWSTSLDVSNERPNEVSSWEDSNWNLDQMTQFPNESGNRNQTDTSELQCRHPEMLYDLSTLYPNQHASDIAINSHSLSEEAINLERYGRSDVQQQQQKYRRMAGLRRKRRDNRKQLCVINRNKIGGKLVGIIRKSPTRKISRFNRAIGASGTSNLRNSGKRSVHGKPNPNRNGQTAEHSIAVRASPELLPHSSHSGDHCAIRGSHGATSTRRESIHCRLGMKPDEWPIYVRNLTQNINSAKQDDFQSVEVLRRSFEMDCFGRILKGADSNDFNWKVFIVNGKHGHANSGFFIRNVREGVFWLRQKEIPECGSGTRKSSMVVQAFPLPLQLPPQSLIFGEVVSIGRVKTFLIIDAAVVGGVGISSRTFDERRNFCFQLVRSFSENNRTFMDIRMKLPLENIGALLEPLSNCNNRNLGTINLGTLGSSTGDNNARDRGNDPGILFTKVFEDRGREMKQNYEFLQSVQNSFYWPVPKEDQQCLPLGILDIAKYISDLDGNRKI